MIDRIKDLEDVIRQGVHMRDAQKAYFRERTPTKLSASKACERVFDQMAKEVLGGVIMTGSSELNIKPGEWGLLRNGECLGPLEPEKVRCGAVTINWCALRWGNDGSYMGG